MSLNSSRPDCAEIRKVWVTGGEAFVVETSVDGADEVDRVVAAVLRGRQIHGFCPSKPESPAYELTLYESDKPTDSVTIEAGCLQFGDGENRQLPDEGRSLIDLLEQLLKDVQVKRMSVMDIFSRMASA